MKELNFILLLVLNSSCSPNQEQAESESAKSFNKTELPIEPVQEPENTSNSILLDGKYRFDIAFAEWDGRSMGEKVTVIIKGDSIKVVYEGDGQLSGTKSGEILEVGKIMKHKSGVWIIASDLNDINMEEIGGCSGGPTIISFKNKTYWMC